MTVPALTDRPSSVVSVGPAGAVSEGSAAVPAVIQPAGLYDCLGWYVFKSEPRYVLRAYDGGLLHLRQTTLNGLDGLLRLWPDIEHWRRLYPRSGGRVDGRAAGADLVRACVAAGPWTGEQITVW